MEECIEKQAMPSYEAVAKKLDTGVEGRMEIDVTTVPDAEVTKDLPHSTRKFRKRKVKGKDVGKAKRKEDTAKRERKRPKFFCEF